MSMNKFFVVVFVSFFLGCLAAAFAGIYSIRLSKDPATPTARIRTYVSDSDETQGVEMETWQNGLICSWIDRYRDDEGNLHEDLMVKTVGNKGNRKIDVTFEAGNMVRLKFVKDIKRVEITPP